jgi:hypothetical protein
MLAFPELVDIHISDEHRKAIRDDKIRSRVFDTLTLGVNYISLEAYDAVAKVIAETDHPKKITFDEVIKLSGEFEDSSGYLV